MYYPVFLNIQDKPCVVIGGGEVAERKVNILLEEGALVTVVSRDLTDELKELARRGAIQVVPRDYRSGDLKGALIAFSATDNQAVNRRVSEEGRQERVLVNVVDDPELCDFIVPSRIRRGDITIAISTSGRSPALARKIRTDLEASIGPEYDALASLLSQVRAEMKDSGRKISGDSWQKALDLEALLPLLKTGKTEQAKKMLVKSLIGSSEG